MLEQVENKILDLKTKQKEEYYKRKDEDLIEWGLTTQKNGKVVTPLIVTDDEYDALIDASNGVSGTNRNKVANLLNAASIATVALAIVIAIAFYLLSDELQLVYSSLSVLFGILFSLVFRGLSEAIKILQRLLDMKNLENKKKLASSARKFPERQPNITGRFTSEDI